MQGGVKKKRMKRKRVGREEKSFVTRWREGKAVIEHGELSRKLR